MNWSQLENILQNEPKYRLKQATKALFVDLIENWNEAMILPKEMREELNKKCPLGIKAKMIESKDKKTVKAVIILKDKLKVESVLMKYDKNKSRNTVCISSQVGCALGCKFCATGKAGFSRNLTIDEIIEQVLLWGKWLKSQSDKEKISSPISSEILDSRLPPAIAFGSGRWRAGRGNDREGNKNGKSIDKITNIVFMGMGEPFLNYDNVISAIKILNDPKGFNLGARHFSISTAGIIDGIKKLAEEPLQINLAISLHAPNDKLRSRLMPINKKYPIKKIIEAADNYIKKTNRKVMFEYIMIDGINDSDKQARELAELMKRPLYFINLIPCNPVGNFDAAAITGFARYISSTAINCRFDATAMNCRFDATAMNCRFKPSPQDQIEKFKAILKNSGIQVNQRYSFGQDIKAACGQLARK